MLGKVTAVLGAQWGDEGKGAVIAELAGDSDIVVRCQGADNAGHTLYDSEGNKIVVNITPSGIIYSHVTNIIGNGVLVNLETLDKNMQGAKGKLLISDAAHLLFDYHKLLDGVQEAGKGSGKIGTTKRGVGPGYADKINRIGIRAGLLQQPQRLEEILRHNIEQKNKELSYYGLSSSIDADTLLAKMKPLFAKYATLVTDTRAYLNQAFHEGKKILLEGAQGTMLDIDHGTYPFVTSSNTTVTGLLAGSGLSPKMLGPVLGVVKAYTSRVGEGIFPTEAEPAIHINSYKTKEDYLRRCFLTESEKKMVLAGDDKSPYYDLLVSRYLRETADEFGSTTGRPRRVGWLDAVALKKAVEINGFDSLVLTRLDNLDGIGRLKICKGYKKPATPGKSEEQLGYFPNDSEALQGFVPQYEVLLGWKNTKGIRTFSELPQPAKDYIATIEHFLGTRFSRIKNGCRQEDYIERK